MPLPIDVELGDGSSITDGWHTITSKEASHIKITSMDTDGFLTYEISPPRKIITTVKSLVVFTEAQLVGTERTITTPNGKSVGEYRYFKRPDGSYYASITGEASNAPHGIELGSFSERDSPISTIARTIAYKFDTRKFSRTDLRPLIPKHFGYSQKLKSILDVLHKEGFLTKEMDTHSRNKAKEIFAATEKLKKVAIPSPSPEQA
jgi:hypothetical protein